MANRSLGKLTVVTAGTRVRATANETDPTAALYATDYIVIRKSGAGDLFVGSATLDRTTWAGVYGILPAPSATAYPAFASSLEGNWFNMADVWFDADQNNQSFLCSIIQR